MEDWGPSGLRLLAGSPSAAQAMCSTAGMCCTSPAPRRVLLSLTMKEAKCHESPCAGSGHHLEDIPGMDQIHHIVQLLTHPCSGLFCAEVYHARLQLTSLHEGEAGHQVFEDDSLHHPLRPPAVQGQDVVGLGRVWIV